MPPKHPSDYGNGRKKQCSAHTAHFPFHLGRFRQSGSGHYEDLDGEHQPAPTLQEFPEMAEEVAHFGISLVDLLGS